MRVKEERLCTQIEIPLNDDVYIAHRNAYIMWDTVKMLPDGDRTSKGRPPRRIIMVKATISGEIKVPQGTSIHICHF